MLRLLVDGTAILDDRRQALRQQTRPKAVMVGDGVAQEAAATLYDVSRLGLRFRSRSCVPCGTEIAIDPPSQSELTPILAEIVWQRVIPCGTDEIYEYGVRFKQLEDEQRHQWFLLLRNKAA